jgi:hypothetical protein
VQWSATPYRILHTEPHTRRARSCRPQAKAVADATAAGFAHLPPGGGAPDAAARAAMRELTSLKGVGPATATAMMAAADASVPYFGDEAWAAACGGKAKYSEAEALQLRGKLRPKAEELRAETGACAAGEGSGGAQPAGYGVSCVKRISLFQTGGELYSTRCTAVVGAGERRSHFCPLMVARPTDPL